MSEIEKSIRLAQIVSVGYPESSPTYTTSATTLVLKVPAFDSNGNLLENTFDYMIITADLSNLKILRKMVFPAPASVRGQVNQVLSTNLSSISFSYLDLAGNLVSPTSASKIDFTINVATPIGVYTQQDSAKSTVSLRNK